MKRYKILGFCVFALLLFQSELKGEEKGIIGSFYFSTSQVNVTQFDITYTRAVIPWEAVESEEGKFNWKAAPLRKIDYILKKGIKVVPVIRTVGANWALKYPERKSSSPPKDLNSSFHPEYGYSRSYYNFVYTVAKRYKGKFPIVVIENEVTARGFWNGTMDEYIKVLITAKKALKDAEPEIKIADSGLASLCWGLLMVNEFFEKGREKEAFEFYKNYFRNQYGRMAGKEGNEKERREKAAEELVKKLTLSVFYNLKSAIIFPFSNPEHNIIGLGDERRKPIEEMIYAFKTSLKFLNYPLRRIQN
ncbi:hypothetical protein J7L87_03645 [bacterium]|nr:hypothetical protein [bacterium]